MIKAKKSPSPCGNGLPLFKRFSRGRTRTCDLRVMSPTSCQLLYPASLWWYYTEYPKMCQPLEWKKISSRMAVETGETRLGTGSSGQRNRIAQ